MQMKVFVDTDGLAAAGSALTSGGSPNTPPQAQPGAADPVSQSLFVILGTRGLIVSGLLAHGSVLRELGGMTVTGTATGFDTTDADNALPFNGNGSPGPSVAPIAAAMPPTPEVPGLPAMPVPPTMPGDAFAALVHGGPGGSALRQTASTLRGQMAPAIRNDADDVVRAGNRIDASWNDDGNQRAGANTISHGGWLHAMADATDTLAGAFDDAADHLDNTRQATPTPEEFQTARRNIALAQAAHDPVAFSKATADYAQLNSRAVEAMYDYHGRATTTTTALDTPLQTAPPIAGGDPASGPDDTIVGDPGSKHGHIQLVDNEGQGSSPPGQPAPPGGQPQIGPFPVPPQVAAATPPGPPPQAPPPADPTGGLLMPQNLPAPTPPPNIPGTTPAPPPGVPLMGPPPAPALPSYPDLVKQVQQQGQQLADQANAAARPTPAGVGAAMFSGCTSTGITAGILGAETGPIDPVIAAGGCTLGALGGLGSYLAGLWATNALSGAG
jgi:hypothetical protein